MSGRHEAYGARRPRFHFFAIDEMILLAARAVLRGQVPPCADFSMKDSDAHTALSRRAIYQAPLDDTIHFVAGAEGGDHCHGAVYIE